MEYLSANIIGLIPWIVIFKIRKDLRKQMLLMSFIALPIAFFDLIYVPTYWKPVTLFNIPIGIEGFLFSFEAGGISAGIGALLARERMEKIKEKDRNKLRFLLLLIPLIVVFIINTFLPVNVSLGMHTGLFVGILSIFLVRKDLGKNLILSGLGFLVIYFLSLFIWANIFPQTVRWFTFQNLPKIFIINVPFYELTFGLLFGAYWGNLYPMLFRYKYKN